MEFYGKFVVKTVHQDWGMSGVVVNCFVRASASACSFNQTTSALAPARAEQPGYSINKTQLIAKQPLGDLFRVFLFQATVISDI